MSSTELERKHRIHPFTQIPNSLLEDKRLSWEARGLLSYLLSKPSGWTVRMGDLIKKSPAGRDATYVILRELKAAGYLEFCRRRDDDGVWHSKYVYDEVPSHQNPIPKKKQDLPLLTDPEKTDGPSNPENPNGKTQTDSNTHGSNNSNELRSLEGENAHTPDPSTLTVREIRVLELTDDQWRELAELEKNGKSRSGVQRLVEAKLNRPPPAVEVFRGNTNRYPMQVLWEGIGRAVGEEEKSLEFWDKVIKHWLACGWSPVNVKGMLEHYQDRRLPSTNSSRNRKSAAHEPARKVLSDEEGEDYQRQMEAKMKAKREREKQEAVAVA